jgi:hypothetical protein
MTTHLTTDQDSPHTAAGSGHPSPALVRAIADADARLAAAPDRLAYLTAERFAANRQGGRGDTLGVGPRLAPR